MFGILKSEGADGNGGVQWQYNGGNGSTMAVQLKPYSHRIGTIFASYSHHVRIVLALPGRNGSTIPAITFTPLWTRAPIAQRARGQTPTLADGENGGLGG